MKKYIILADVTCDLSAPIREQFGVKDYLQGHIHFSDGRDFNTTLDWTHISREDFYKALHVLKISLDELEKVSRCVCEFFLPLFICLFKIPYICD